MTARLGLALVVVGVAAIAGGVAAYRAKRIEKADAVKAKPMAGEVGMFSVSEPAPTELHQRIDWHYRRLKEERDGIRETTAQDSDESVQTAFGFRE